MSQKSLSYITCDTCAWIYVDLSYFSFNAEAELLLFYFSSFTLKNQASSSFISCLDLVPCISGARLIRLHSKNILITRLRYLYIRVLLPCVHYLKLVVLAPRLIDHSFPVLLVYLVKFTLQNLQIHQIYDPPSTFAMLLAFLVKVTLQNLQIIHLIHDTPS